MRLALLLLALAASPSGRFDRVNSRTPQGRSHRGLPGVVRADFEFAPLDGAGMGVACAGTVPTGAKGETMTFARASVATCIKGSTTSLQPGDMVVLSANQPRVMPGGDGTGGLGILQEPSTTNYALRSQELDNAAWTRDLTAPTITADYALAPDGTQTAERVQFPAADSRIYQAVQVTTPFGSLWARGTSGAATFYLWYTGSGGTFTNATVCSVTASAWTPCKIVDPGNGASRLLAFGCQASQFGMPGSCAAADVLLWGAQSATNDTSYIPTAGATVARAADQLTGGSSVGVESAGCASATLIPEWSGLNGPNESVVSSGTAGRYLYVRNATASMTVYDGTTVVGIAGSFVAGSPKKMRSSWSGSTMSIYNVSDSTSNSGAFDGTMATGTIELGYSSWGTTGVGGVIKNVKVDRNPGGCL